jgi:hypothetical protein
MPHETTFQRNTKNGLWRADCSCGWFMIGEQVAVQCRAGSHDIDDLAVEPVNAEDWEVVS